MPLPKANLRRLVPPSAWHYLDSVRQCRDQFKSFYSQGIPVHLQDQAVFNAVATMVQFIESGLASTHTKARIFTNSMALGGGIVFWLLRRYERIGSVPRGETPVPGFDLAIDDRRVVAQFLRRTLRRSSGRHPG